MNYKPNNRLIDIVGNKYAHLFVIGLAPNSRTGKPRWLCKCDCGSIKSYYGSNLKSGKTNTCSTKCIFSPNRKHGMSKTPEFRSWASMMGRCYRIGTNQYHNYGGRGIKVCGRWLEFVNFFEDMGRKPTIKHQIDRIDSNKNYEPTNCKWSTVKEQSNNRRTNKIVVYRGESLTVAQWADKLGFKYSTLKERLSRGWDVERAFNERPEMHHLFRQTL